MRIARQFGFWVVCAGLLVVAGRASAENGPVVAAFGIDDPDDVVPDVSEQALQERLSVLLIGAGFRLVPVEQIEAQVRARQRGLGAGARGFAGTKAVEGRRRDIHRFAVVIGISKYHNADKVAPLAHAADDAKAFYQFIRTPAGGGFEADKVRLLVDEQATAAAVRSALGTFLKQATRDDLVYIYFAGHGAPEPDNPRNLYFLTWEADPDDLFGTALPMDVITTILKRHLYAERVVVLTDACHSAGVGGDLAGMRAAGPNRINDFVRELARTRPGRAVVTGSRTGEYSQEGERWGGGHGAFTFHWIEGLKGAADRDGNGIVTLGEAIDHVSRRVARDTNNAQHPDSMGDFDNDMPLAVLDPGQADRFRAAEQESLARQTEKQSEDRRCHGQACRLEIARELAAQKSLAARIRRIGDGCQVSLVLTDLRSAAAEAGGVAEGDCTAKALSGALDRAVELLAAKAGQGAIMDAPRVETSRAEVEGMTRRGWGTLSSYGGLILGGGMAGLGAALKYMDFGGEKASETDKLAGDVLIWGGVAIGTGLLVTGLVLIFTPDEDDGADSTTALVGPSHDGHGLVMGVRGRW